MLLWWPKYELVRWVPNPLNFQASDAYRKRSPPVVMTCRLDGPTAEIAKRLVDDAIAVEAKGLAGNVVIDARGITFDRREGRLRARLRRLRRVVPRDREAARNGRDEGHARPQGSGASRRKREGRCPLLRAGIRTASSSTAASTSPVRSRGTWPVPRRSRCRRQDTQVWCPNLLKKGVCGHARPGRGAVHGRLSEAGRVLRLPGDRRIHAGRVLFADACSCAAG